MDNMDPDLKNLFDSVGITADQLQDKETATFIYDFIEERGGINAIKQQTSDRPPPPPVPHSSVGPLMGNGKQGRMMN